MTFFDWLTKIGTVGSVAIILGFAAVIAAGIIIIIRGRFTLKIGETVIKSEGSTHGDVSRHEKSLLEHDFFLNMTKIVYGDFVLSIEDPCKKTVVEMFYRLICRTSFKAMTDFVVRFEKKEILPVEALGLLASIIADYNMKSKAMDVDLPNGKKIKGIPSRLIDIFDSWHDPHITLISDKCVDIIRSQFHDDERAKMTSILDVIDLGYRITLSDLMLSANQMNGELTTEIDAMSYSCPDA